MITDEFVSILDRLKFTTMKPVTKIIVSEAMFNRLCGEAINYWGASILYSTSPNDYEPGFKVRFMNIPIQIGNLPDGIAHFYFGFEEFYCASYIIQEIPKDIQKANITTDADKLDDISEDALISVLNSGGYKAIKQK